MSDLLRLLQMLQQGGQSTPQSDFPAPLHPRIMEQRNMLRGDPYAEAIFQQAYGGQDNTGDAPQMEQPAHPNVERFAGGMMQAIGDTNYRPRNFGEGLLLGGLQGAGGAIMGKAGEREAGNAEKKAAYKAEQKAAYEQKLLAQKQYGDMAMDARKNKDKPEQSLTDKVAEKKALIAAGIEAADETNKRLGRPRWKPEAAIGEFSPEAVAFLAQQYSNYGALPPRGILTNPQGRAIIESAAGTPGANPAAGKADLASNQAALVQITKNLNAVEAFGKTAEKNAQVMLNRMKLIPDTGSPYLNTPIRELAAKAGGSAEVAAYRAALTTVIPEFARILNNPNLTGQLTDTARKEMEHVIDGSSTLNQMQRVFEVLKQDKANRIADLNSQRDALRSAIRTPAGEGSAGGAPVVKWGLGPDGKTPVKVGQ